MQRISALNTEVFLFPTDVDHAHHHVVSSEERERAARFHFERDRKRHVVCRATLRLILAERMGVPPEEIVFTFNAYGKPAIRNAPIPIDFNLSHSGTLAVLGVTTGAPVGIDIEHIRDLADWKGIARRFYSPREYDWLQSLPASERMLGFYRLWTLKEAVLKADGRGLSFPLSEIEISLNGTSAQLTGGDWRLIELPLAPGYTAAMATR